MLNLYLISQTENENYDTYDSAVVAAPDEEAAKQIHPSGDQTNWTPRFLCNTWCSKPSAVTVQYIGIASGEIPAGKVILSSFNAG